MFNDLGQQALEYMRDAQQRSILYLDAMRQSGDQYVEHVSEGKPPVLIFDHELIVDGRDLPDPVNYGLLRILPPVDMPTNHEARPFVIIDPRAGHGPGVAGSKLHSEIGVALAAGHPCYFVTFGPDPEPNQSIYCILKAEKHFLEVVAERHDHAKVCKPFIIGNCQGGWAAMMLASVAPKLVGPIMLAGAPLAYWSGKAGQNPMRYSGGMLGGSWTSSLSADLGHGLFDGANLVDNFENLDPANTFWKKPYRLYSKIDTEIERYLGFDRWWTGHFLMTRQEIDWIVQNLFIGNRLARAELPDPLSGGNINLRNIRSPILVFASQGDNITPPPQALNWIPDMYASDADLRAHEQVIVYNLHDHTGHLGIFVSSGIANREHEALVSALDLIELLPPGLYEAKIQDLHPDTPHLEWVKGRHVVSFEPRSIKDLEAYDDGRDEEADFEVVNRVSAMNQHLYDLTLSPLVRSLSSPWTAQAARQLHPKRFSRYSWSSLNPIALSFQPMAEQVRENRQPVSEDNVFLSTEKLISDSISRNLDIWRDIRDRSIESLFHSIYSSPVLRALMGLDESPMDRRGFLDSDSALQEELHELRLQLTKAQVNQGGAKEAFARILIYMAGEDTFVDERAFNLLKSLIHSHVEKGYVIPDLDTIKQGLREQWRIVSMHPKEAIAALPILVPDQQQRMAIWRTVEEVAQLKDILHSDLHTHERFVDIACALHLCNEWHAPQEVMTKLHKEQLEQEAQAKAAIEAEKMAAVAEAEAKMQAKVATLEAAAAAKAHAETKAQAQADKEKALAKAKELAAAELAEHVKKIAETEARVAAESKKTTEAMLKAKQEVEQAREAQQKAEKQLQELMPRLKADTQAKSVAEARTTVAVEPQPAAKKATKKVAKKATAARKASKKSSASKATKK